MKTKKPKVNIIGHNNETPLYSYLQEISKYELLKSYEEKELGKRIQEKNDKSARDKLIKHNLRLVVNIAKRYIRRGVNYLDLIQEGNVGLIRAVDKFDASLGYRVSTYATWWIKQSLKKCLQEQRRTIRLPAHAEKTIIQYQTRKNSLSNYLGHKPKLKEISYFLDISIKEIKKIEQLIKIDPISLSTPMNEDNGTLDMMIGEEQEFDTTWFKKAVTEAINELDEREGKVITYRFGLDDNGPSTLQEIGDRFGFTREWARLAEAKALKSLKHPKRKKKLRDFY